MALSVNLNGDNLPLQFKAFDASAKVLNCVTIQQPNPDFFIDYPLEIKYTFAPERFKAFILQRKGLRENDIFEVHDKSRNTRVGWCFPIQSLCSTEHSYAKNEYFLNYASIAAIRLFDDANESCANTPTVTDNTNLSFLDFFSETTAVLVISLEKIDNPNGFLLNDWMPSLFQYGYTPFLNQPNRDVVFTGIRPENIKLQITSVSTEMQNRIFVDNVFSSLLPYESNSLLLFFYQYQLVELLLGQVFEVEQKSLVEKLVNCANDSVKTKEVLSEINEISSEKKRLRLLFESYMSDSLEKTQFLEVCNNFLIMHKRETSTNLHESLYKVRNLLFHQYRDILGSSEEQLKEICQEFSYFLVQLLSKYKARTSEQTVTMPLETEPASS